MSAFVSDPGLDGVRDAAGHGTEVDVAVHLHDGMVRLAILWTQETLLSTDDADHVALALQRAAELGRMITVASPPDRSTSACIPLSYNLHGFKARARRGLSPVCAPAGRARRRAHGCRTK